MAWKFVAPPVLPARDVTLIIAELFAAITDEQMVELRAKFPTVARYMVRLVN